MNLTTKLLSVLIVPFAVATISVVPSRASAATVCSVSMSGTTNTANQSTSRWTVDANGVATGTLQVTGDENCTQTVTLASWQAPNADKGMPYDQQKLVGHTTQTFGVGTHTLSIKTPDCFYQLDMVRGGNAAGDNGTPLYAKGSLIGSLHGGTKACDVTPPVTPAPTATPAPTQTPVAPTTLPNTGVGSNVLYVGVLATVLGTAYQYYRRLRVA